MNYCIQIIWRSPSLLGAHLLFALFCANLFPFYLFNTALFIPFAKNRHFLGFLKIQVKLNITCFFLLMG